MTPQEKLIRAREACAAAFPHHAESFRDSGRDSSGEMTAALRALTDLDKPIPDPDEAWRPFLEAITNDTDLPSTPLDVFDRERIARIRAARHLMPPEEIS